MPALPPPLPQDSYDYDPDRWTFDDDRYFGRHTRIKLFGAELDFQFTYEQDGYRPTDRSISLHGMMRRGRDLTPVFESFRSLLYNQTEEVFANEGLPTPWVPLNTKYARWKRKVVGDMPILQRSQRLYRSLIGGPEGVFQAHPQSLEYGSMVPYLDAHQEGYDSLPARPPLVLLPDTFEVMNRAIMDYITGRGR